MESNALGEIMTVEEVAAYLKLSTGTIYNKVSKDEIPFLKVGNPGSLRFRRSEIDDWLESHRHTRTAAEPERGPEAGPAADAA